MGLVAHCVRSAKNSGEIECFVLHSIAVARVWWARRRSIGVGWHRASICSKFHRWCLTLSLCPLCVVIFRLRQSTPPINLELSYQRQTFCRRSTWTWRRLQKEAKSSGFQSRTSIRVGETILRAALPIRTWEEWTCEKFEVDGNSNQNLVSGESLSTGWRSGTNFHLKRIFNFQQNRRYKTKRKQIQQHEAAILAASKRVVPVQVLVRDDGSYCRMMNPPSAGGYPQSGIDQNLFSKLNLTDIYRQQVRLDDRNL